MAGRAVVPEPAAETVEKGIGRAMDSPVRISLDTGYRDMRARRPLMGRLAAAGTLRKLLRVVSLLLVDLAGVAAAIFAATALEALTDGGFSLSGVASATADVLPVLFGITAVLFADAGLYGPRERRPGMGATI